MTMTMLRRLRPVLGVAAAMIVTVVSVVAAAEDHLLHHSRRLEIDSDTSDPFAEAIVFARPHEGPGVGATDHARITSILTATKEMMTTARVLFKDPGTQNEANEMLAMATAMFGEVKEFMRERVDKVQAAAEEKDRLLRAKYVNHDVQKAREDEERALDITRSIYETVSSKDICILSIIH